LLGVTLILAALPLYSLAGRFQSMNLSADREAYSFAQRVLDAAAANAIVISSGDRQAFSLWYVHDALGHRPDVVVVEKRLLTFAWYRNDLAARYPDMANVALVRNAQEAIAVLIQSGSQSRPVHLTFSDETILELARWDYSAPLHTLISP